MGARCLMRIAGRRCRVTAVFGGRSPSQISHPPPAIFRVRRALRTQPVFKITLVDVDIAEIPATVRAFGLVLVGERRRRESRPVLVNDARFRRARETHRAVPLQAAKRSHVVDEVNFCWCAACATTTNRRGQHRSPRGSEHQAQECSTQHQTQSPFQITG